MRILSRVVVVGILFLIIASLVTPWTQTAPGSGRVIAYSPIDRETPIRAATSGRLVRWLVNEGAQVEEGQAIAELADNDSKILERLGSMRDATLSQGVAIESALSIAAQQIEALSDARDAALEHARSQVTISMESRNEKKQLLLAARASEATAALNVARQEELNRKGLTSDRDLEVAQLQVATARSETIQREAALRAASMAVQAAEAKLSETRENHRASIEKAGGELAKLKAEASKVTGQIAQAETKLSQQEQMTVIAPRAGRILSVAAREGDIMKAGDQLAVLVPDTLERSVELWVDGNDAPLIGEGRRVRLQFEGWPAAQFAGWPSVAVGTFGGKVAFVDQASRADGMFRVMVLPDPEDDPWPEAKYLRQGVRARGWVQLNRVTVAYEIWRQFNGFPPALNSPDAEPSEY